MNEVHYDTASWASICGEWLSRYATIPNGRVVIPGCGKNGERNSNEMGALHQFGGCLLAVHLYNPWDGTSGDATVWYNLAASEIEPYGERTIVTEYGQSMTSGIDYGTGSTSKDPIFAYMVGLTKYMRDHRMGGTHWVGLRERNPVDDCDQCIRFGAHKILLGVVSMQGGEVRRPP